MAGNRTRFEEALRRGNAFNERRQWKQAFQMFRVALSEFPQSAEAFAGLGEACFGLKMLARALESYKLAARYSRGELQYLQKVADLQERLGQLGEAARTYMATGELQLRQRDLDAAVANWQRAVRLDSTLLGAHRRLAMVFQRQGNVKAAVREYLAIARTLQMRGDSGKALQMCRAALRLDPDNDDVLLAIDLVRHGEAAFREGEPEVQRQEAAPPNEERDEMAETVRQIANVFEEERKNWTLAQDQPRADDPVSVASRLAQEDLAEEIFRDEENEADLYGTGDGLSKLERDALVGQGMDFQTRGQTEQAIHCYEKAVVGGLKLPAAYFILGQLYLEQKQAQKARQLLSRAASDQRFYPAIKALLSQ